MPICITIRSTTRTRVAYFGAATAATLAAEGFGADLLVGNHVLAHIRAWGGQFVVPMPTIHIYD